jgi:uncharacterized Zn-finger protein
MPKRPDGQELWSVPHSLKCAHVFGFRSSGTQRVSPNNHGRYPRRKPRTQVARNPSPNRRSTRVQPRIYNTASPPWVNPQVQPGLPGQARLNTAHKPSQPRGTNDDCAATRRCARRPTQPCGISPVRFRCITVKLSGAKLACPKTGAPPLHTHPRLYTDVAQWHTPQAFRHVLSRWFSEFLDVNYPPAS